MRFNHIHKTAILVLTFIILLIPAYIYGWHTGIYFEELNVDAGVEGGYFAGGDGSQANPYQIETSIHLKNLSLLQNNGKFQPNTYFTVNQSFDASNLWIPPIGSTAHPFNGFFNGNGKIISGIRVTTDSTKNKSKLAATAFGDVGLFGMVGITTEKAIHDFTLADIYVDHTASLSSGYSGIIAGSAGQHVINNVGVYTARLSYAPSITATSKYALIGNTVADADGSVDTSGRDLYIQAPISSTTLDKANFSEISGSNKKAYFLGEIKCTSDQSKPEKMYQATAVESAQGTSYTADSSTSSEIDILSKLSSETFQGFWNNTSFYPFRPREDMTASDSHQFIIDDLSIQAQSCIWFRPQSTGTSKMILLAQSKNTVQSMDLYRLTRKNGEISKKERIMTFNITSTELKKHGFYFEFDIDALQDAEGNPYEFILGADATHAGSACYFLYFELCGVGESGSESSASITGVDWVRQNEIITDSWNAAESTSATGVLFEINVTGNVVIYFKREDGSDGSIKVYYEPASDIIKPIGMKSRTEGSTTLSTNTTDFPIPS